MALFQQQTNQRTPPVWAADDMGPPNLIPGGARVDATAFTADSRGRKHIPAGTLLGRTRAERDAGTGFGLATALDEEVYLLAFDVDDAAFNADCELYRHNRLVKENFLPNWATLAEGTKTQIRDLYECVIGIA